MALIKCPECGKEISDKAVSCPNCGVPISSKGCTVYFEREKKLAASGTTGIVYVDGKSVGMLSNGGSFDVELPFGMHNVGFETKIPGEAHAGRTNQESLNIPANAKKVIVKVVVQNDFLSFMGNGIKLGIDRVQVC